MVGHDVLDMYSGWCNCRRHGNETISSILKFEACRKAAVGRVYWRQDSCSVLGLTSANSLLLLGLAILGWTSPGFGLAITFDFDPLNGA